MDEMDISQFKEVFLSEAKEHLVSLNSALLVAVKNPSNKETLNQVFRSAHTLKGMAAIMDFNKITDLSRTMENLVDKLLRNELRATAEIVDLISKTSEVLKKLIEDVETNTDSGINIDALMASFGKLTDLQKQKPYP
ncbi:MAG: Hpt domain-containing protein [Elusimicrobia bacterium]|nr:Hpt domain-containing protein [Candidatus Liberimonas magnetica]